MLTLSELLIANPELGGFKDLVHAVRRGAHDARFFRMDVRPPYGDTPDNWEDVLEGAFSGVLDQ
jgi:hypothetical protein